MKRIKIFLASSVEDLREDRLQVGDFFRQLNELYLDSGVHFSLIKCEDYDSSIVDGGKQQEFDREIRESELVFFLFFKKVGDYTRHELEVALEAFQNQTKPRVIIYFKYVNNIEEVEHEVHDFMQFVDREMKHYYNTYGNIDTLKLGILMQIKLLKLDRSEIKLENGAVLLNGQAVASCEKVPSLHGNQTLRELTEKRRQLQAALHQYRQTFLLDPTSENEAQFFNTSAELNRVSKQLTEVEKETMALLTTVAEMKADGRVLTHRQKEALKCFDRGDYTAVYSILEDVERENEYQRACQRADVAKKEIQGYVEEELLLIKTEMAQGLTVKRVQRILKSYRKISELVEKYDLQKEVLYEYAWFLHAQNQYTEAIAVAEKLRWHYSDPSCAVKEQDKAALHNMLGNLYCSIGRYDEAEKSHGRAMEIYTRLAERESEAYARSLASCYNNLSILYCRSRRYEKAEEAQYKAIDIYRRLSESNPSVYASDLAASYNNLGSIYGTIGLFKEAEDAYTRASEIYSALSDVNPDAYASDLALCYNNLGSVYASTWRCEDAEDHLRKAVEIRSRLAIHNPGAYEPDLAMSYNNLATLYRSIGRYRDAEQPQDKAVEIYTRLAARYPNAYEPNLAEVLWNTASICWRMGEKRREKYFWALHTVLPVYESLARKNPDRYERDVRIVRELLE